MAFNIGDKVRIGNHLASGAAAFTKLDGTVTDPTTVTLTLRRKNGSVLVYGWPVAGANGALTAEATGRFYFDVPLDADGVWKVRLVGTGAVVAVQQTAFTVARSLVS